MILITGATGHVGSELVAQLAARGEAVRAMTRRVGEARMPAGVEVVGGSFDEPASLDAALSGVDGVFLMSAQPSGSAERPTHDLAAASACARAGVRRVVKLSVLGGGGEVDDALTRWHREAEAAVRGYGGAWTLLRPGRFMSNALGWAAMIREGVVRVPFAARPAASIDPADIAAVAARALTEPGHEGKAYELSGPEALTPADEVAILGEVLGRELTLVALPPEVVRQGLVRSGMSAEVIEAVMERSLSSDHGAQVLPTVERVLGRAPRSFAAWARAHAGAFR